MPIFTEPDRTQYPSSLEHATNPGLETLTGADLAISRFPLSVNESTLNQHIQCRTLFVQVKIGYDILSFDGLKSSIARMQKCQIPMPQCILLFIGRDWQEDNTDLLRIENSKPFGKTTYKTFIKLKAKWRARGGIVDWLNDIEQLPMWIEAQQEVLADIENEGKRELYPSRPVPQFEPEDVWQPVTEVPKDDIRYFLCAGMDGFGAKTGNNVIQYIHENLAHLEGSGFYFLKVLTDEDKKGKAIHEVKGWGDKSRERLRLMMSLPKGFNLDVKEVGITRQYEDGWYAAMKCLKEMIESGHPVRDAFNSLIKQANEFFGKD
jgi:hypothetical protein